MSQDPSKPKVLNKYSDQLSVTTKVVGTISTLALLGGSWKASPQATTLLPIIFAPTLLVLYYRRTLPAAQRSNGSLETLIWVYLITGTVGMVGLIAVQIGLSYAFTSLLFGPETDWFAKEFQNGPRDPDVPEFEHKEARAAFAARPSYWVYLLFMAFILAGVCEEGLKYLAVVLAKRFRGGSLGSHKEYLICGAVAALSFSTIENALFVMVACKAGETGWKLALTLFERLLGGSLGHMLGGVSVALGIIKKDERKEDISITSILSRSVLVHGLWDLSLMGISASEGNIGWVHPASIYKLACCYLIVIGLMLILAIDLRSETRKLKIN